MASMDAEATAVIKKNNKKNNTKGCAKVMEKLPQHIRGWNLNKKFRGDRGVKFPVYNSLKLR